MPESQPAQENAEPQAASVPEQGQESAPEPPKPHAIEDLLGPLDDDARKAVLGQLSKARNEAKGLRERVKSAEPKLAEYDKLLDAQKSAEQRALDAATAAEKRAQAAITRAVKSDIKALATERFADPDDAADALDAAAYVDADGDIDTAGIKAALDELLERKPHWARKGEQGARRPAPDPSQGSSGNSRASLSEGEQFAAFLKSQRRN